MAGRYAKNGTPNFEVYLKGHAGDPLRVDRIGRPPVFVPHPALTVGLALQPDVIRSLADKPGFRGRGLLGRFLYSMPKSPVGHRLVDPPAVPEKIRNRYEVMIRAMLDLEGIRPPQGYAQPYELTFTREAQGVLFDFMGKLEPKLADGGELGIISDWAGKLAGAIVRISGLFHMVEHSGHQSPWHLPIEGHTLHSAVCIGEYLVPHAQAAFAEMGANPQVQSAKRVLTWIQRERLECFSKRDAFNALRGRFKTITELDPALGQLVERSFIRLRVVEKRSGPGRAPSPIYDVNPDSHKPQNPQNYSSHLYSAESAYSADHKRHP
ncbi:MAG: YfjI family protein [Myxococcota bacterium]